jgi:putative ABC transport system ATP-binding protein
MDAKDEDEHVTALRPAGPLISLSRVHKVYGGTLLGVHALHDIDLQVAPGEIVTVCGPCGSGKTSLLHVAGMLDTATEGNVVVANLLVSKLSEQARADLRNDLIGFVFQAFSLVPVMTVRENVMLPLLLRARLERAELARAHERADALLVQLGLATQSSHYPPRLDASQSQRVAIARALVTRPRLVIADEPTSRLDAGAVRMVMDVFGRYQDEQGTAFLISTRDQRQLSRATRTLQLSEGRLLSTPLLRGRRPAGIPR